MKIEPRLNQPENWAREARIEKILSLLKKKIVENICPDVWFWGADGDLRVEENSCKKLFSLADDEVEACASASCLVDLWAFRALGRRLIIPIPKLDWFWYNN